MTLGVTSHLKEGTLRVAILGAGRVGRVLGLRLVKRGFQVSAIASRARESAERLATDLGVERVAGTLSEIPAASNVVLVCVPDSEIENVIGDLALLDRNWSGTVVVHTSGTIPASVLSPLEDRGATVVSFHPLQAMTRKSSQDVLNDAYVGLEGSSEGIAAGEKLAAALGMKSVVVPTEGKARYHLAAVMASNLFVTQVAMAEEVLRSVEMGTSSASELLRPLVQGTLSNLDGIPAGDALTGPVIRGDLRTLKEHIKTLKTHFPHLLPAYLTVSREAARLAGKSEQLGEERLDMVVAFLEQEMSG